MNLTIRSLSTRLAVWFLLLGAIPSAVMAVFVERDIEASIRELVAHENEEQALALLPSLQQGRPDATAASRALRGTTGEFEGGFIVDRNDSYAAHSESAKAGQSASADFDAVARAAWRKSAHGSFVDSHNIMIGYAALPGESGHVLVMSTTSGEAEEAIAGVVSAALPKLLFGLLLLAFGSVLIIRVTVGEPLRSLTGAADAVAGGLLDARVDPDEMDDELAVLGHSFNRMTDQLAELVSGLEASEQRFHAIVDSMNDALFIHDVETWDVVDVNETMCRMYGCDRAAAIGCKPEHYASGKSPYDLGHAQQYLRRATAGEALVFEWLAHHSDGHSFWVEVNMRRAEIGGVDRILAVARDITQRKQAEAAIADVERRFRELLDRARFATVMLDVEGRVTYVNDYLCLLTGWQAEELTGRDAFSLLLPTQMGQDAKAGWAAILEARQPIRSEWELPRRDGGKELVIWDTAVLVNQDGCVTGTASLGRDVTAERAMEEHLRESAKLEAVGKLAGGVAHDFNNLLTSIVGYTEVLLDDPVHDCEELRNIRAASEQARLLTKQLLAFSRRQMLQPQVWQLNEIIESMRPLLPRMLGEKVALDIALADELAPVLVDRSQMEQVLMNLLVNARDALPRGGRIGIVTRMSPSGDVELGVSDDGQGMRPEVTARVFEPFFTTKEVGHGTGLGLSTVHGIVMQSGGRIEVKSEVGRGTSFHVLLPAAAASAAALTQTAAPVAAGRPTTEPSPGSHPPRSVLVVEDNRAALRVVEAALLRAGCEVRSATCGADALEWLKQSEIELDLLLTDVVMPGMSGPELATAARELRPTLPVLFMSGYTDDALGGEGVLPAGVNLIEKPFGPRALLARISEILAASESKAD